MSNLLSFPGQWQDQDLNSPPAVWDGTTYGYNFPTTTLTWNGTATAGDVLAFSIIDTIDNSTFSVIVNGSPVASLVPITATSEAYSYNIPSGASVVLTYTVINSCAGAPQITVTPTVVHDAPHAPDIFINCDLNSVNSANTPQITQDGSPVTPDSLTLTTSPAHGTASVSGVTILYTPTNGYSGTDLFNYKATVDGVDSNVAAVNVTVGPDCQEYGRTTSIYVTGYNLSRQAVTRVRRFAKRCLKFDFNGAFPPGCTITHARFETTSPWSIRMSNPRIESGGRRALVTGSFNFAGWGGVLCTVTLSNGEVYNGEFSFTVIDAPLYPTATYPTGNGPYRLDAFAT